MKRNPLPQLPDADLDQVVGGVDFRSFGFGPMETLQNWFGGGGGGSVVGTGRSSYTDPEWGRTYESTDAGWARTDGGGGAGWSAADEGWSDGGFLSDMGAGGGRGW